VRDFQGFAKETGLDWRKASFQTSDHPAVNVRWENTVAFCEWLTQKERIRGRIGKDQRYRLPSDHEWSRAVGIGGKEDAGLPPKAKDQKLRNV
jgi:formylglycine-generating enzyme required for sulfatase activity